MANISKPTLNEKERIAELKRKYVEYYRDAPIQKYAAMHIGRDQDTIITWRAKDAEFAEAVDQAKAAFVSSKMKKAKVEFVLERLIKEFTNNLDLTTGGEKIQFTVVRDSSETSQDQHVLPDQTS